MGLWLQKKSGVGLFVSKFFAKRYSGFGFARAGMGRWFRWGERWLGLALLLGLALNSSSGQCSIDTSLIGRYRFWKFSPISFPRHPSKSLQKLFSLFDRIKVMIVWNPLTSHPGFVDYTSEPVRGTPKKANFLESGTQKNAIFFRFLKDTHCAEPHKR